MKLPAISYQLSAISLIAVCFLLVACGKKTAPTLKAYQKPEQPANLKAIHREDKIILQWSYGKNINLTGFHILKAEGADFEKLASVGKDENSYTDTAVKTDTTYKYKIVARSLKDVLSNDSNIVVLLAKPLPPAPKNFSYRPGNDALVLTWASSSEQVLYNVYKTADKGKYPLTAVNNEPLAAATYSDAFDLTRPFYYTVRALLNNDTRDESFESNEIEVNPADFIPSKPEGLNFVKGDDKVVISWKENPEAWVKKYRVYRKTSEAEGFKLSGESSTPAFVDREKTGKKHVYKVTAAGPSKESEFSKTIEVDF